MRRSFAPRRESGETFTSQAAVVRETLGDEELAAKIVFEVRVKMRDLDKLRQREAVGEKIARRSWKRSTCLR